MLVRSTDADLNRELTEEELKMLKEADESEIVFDEDSPKLSEEQLKKFKRVSSKRAQ